MSIPAGIECVNLKGKQFPLTGAVLQYAQQSKYLRSLEVEIIQFPSEANGRTCICSATATFAPPDSEVQVYTDIGDASPASTSANIAPHAIRLASTRAIGRVLRWGCGISQAVFEEMGDDGAPEERMSAQREYPSSPAPSPPPVAAKVGNGSAGSGTGKFCEHEGCGLELTGPQVAASFKLFKRFFCPAHSAELQKRLAASPAL